MGLGRINGPTIAASIFLPKYKAKYIPTKKTRIIGVVGDMIIGAMLGVGSVYMLSATGKDNHLLKGAGAGHAAWTSLYDVLARMGASGVYPMDEDTNLNGLISHTVYGLVTSESAVRLGDESLFKPSQAKNSFFK